MTARPGPKARLLAEFLADPGRRRYGYELMHAIDAASGTLYAQLDRMEKAGVVKSGWDTAGRKPRRYYTLTPDGVAAARLELAALEAAAVAEAARRGLAG